MTHAGALPRRQVTAQVTYRAPDLIDDARHDPFSGIGKPEQLRHALSGTWSRRITEEYRLVYLVDGDDLVVLQARFHYR